MSEQDIHILLAEDNKIDQENILRAFAASHGKGEALTASSPR